MANGGTTPARASEPESDASRTGVDLARHPIAQTVLFLGLAALAFVLLGLEQGTSDLAKSDEWLIWKGTAAAGQATAVTLLVHGIAKLSAVYVPGDQKLYGVSIAAAIVLVVGVWYGVQSMIDSDRDWVIPAMEYRLEGVVVVGTACTTPWVATVWITYRRAQEAATTAKLLAHRGVEGHGEVPHRTTTSAGRREGHVRLVRGSRRAREAARPRRGVDPQPLDRPDGADAPPHLRRSDLSAEPQRQGVSALGSRSAGGAVGTSVRAIEAPSGNPVSGTTGVAPLLETCAGLGEVAQAGGLGVGVLGGEVEDPTIHRGHVAVVLARPACAPGAGAGPGSRDLTLRARDLVGVGAVRADVDADHGQRSRFGAGLPLSGGTTGGHWDLGSCSGMAAPA
jgi:hypothetical protein